MFMAIATPLRLERFRSTYSGCHRAIRLPPRHPAATAPSGCHRAIRLPPRHPAATALLVMSCFAAFLTL
jgi:hypothetical protein